MYRSALAVVSPALEAEATSIGKLTAYIRSNIAYFDTHRRQLAALAQLGAGYQPSDGRRFDELGMTADLREELAVLDPTPILIAGQQDHEFGDFPAESMAIALRGAVNAVVEKILREPTFDAPSYADDLVAIIGRAVEMRR